MPAARGGRRPGDDRPGRPDKKGAGRPRAQRPSRPPRAPRAPRLLPEVSDDGFSMDTPRPFRPVPEYRVESTTGLRHEVIELRAEVHRLAAEIDKLWARERGRAATPGRTARSIAGKPVRTGTRASRPGGVGRAAPGGAGPKRKTPSGAGGRSPGGPKRATGAKRSSGWAKPKTRSRRSGTTPRRQGR
jgi:hypothetical protein